MSQTTGGWLHVESGLEYELLRSLDRDPAVHWLVPQPCRLLFDGDRGSHVPDMLSEGESGGVTIWDARSPDRQDDAFRQQSEATAAACATVGWAYEVFSGFGTIRHLNLVWLHSFRRSAEWTGRWSAEILTSLRPDAATTIGTLLDRDDGSGQYRYSVWHLLWAGALHVDLDARLSRESRVTAANHG